jgi:ribonuclease J
MNEVRLTALGGLGKVTQNMYLYEYQDEILIMDCGIGFPDFQQPGADILIPDIQHLLKLLEQGKKIVGVILSHGHDDHIAALPYILPDLINNQTETFMIYGSPLTVGFAENRLADGGVQQTVTVIKDHQWYSLGNHFQFSCHAVTHSVPDTKHFFIRTPAGMLYHGTDFKIDQNPVDGVKLDEARISEVVAQEPVLLMTIDCLRVEQKEWVSSESATGPVIREQMENITGKVLVTLMSSHIHRIQQTVDSAIELGRKVVFVGRSVEQNVEVARRLKLLHIPKDSLIDKKDIPNYQDGELCIIIAGSQGQEGSSLVRAVYGDHRAVQITNKDVVIFASGAIPGNEVAYFSAIDELCRNSVHVVYPNIVPDLHESGHGSALEQQYLLKLVNPKMVMPIGGADRHRVKFLEFVAQEVGFDQKNVVIPKHGAVVSFFESTTNDDFGYKVVDQATIVPRIVDGLGIGDVGPRVLSERKALGGAGMIVVVVPRHKGKLLFQKVQVVSRGFVFMQEAQEVMKFISNETVKIIQSMEKNSTDQDMIKKVERKLAKKLYSVIRREPLIILEILEM